MLTSSAAGKSFLTRLADERSICLVSTHAGDNAKLARTHPCLPLMNE